METSAAPEPAPPVPATERPRLLGEEMAGLQARFAQRPVTLREVIVILRGRAYSLLLIFLALPFCTPIPLPGVSTPLGLVIAVIALRLALGQIPWLPAKLLDRQLPSGFFGRLVGGTTGIIRMIEKFLRPRLAPLTDHGWLRQLHAVMMLVAALVLLLPLPIPFTNAFPGWVILLIAGGLMERDGVAIAAGYAVFAAGVVYFSFLGGATHHMFDALRQWIAG